MTAAIKDITRHVKIIKMFYIVLTTVVFVCIDTIHSEETTFEPKFSTKTGYDLAFNKNDLLKRELSWKNLFPKTSHHDIQMCKPAGIYVIYRHGSRYPSSKDINKFNTLLDRVKNSSINPKHQNLQNGKQMSVDLQRTLSESGKLELKNLAMRLKKRFPALFPSDFRLSDFAFQTSNLSRTVDSTMSFIQGMTEHEKVQNMSVLQLQNQLTVSHQMTSGSEEVIVPLYNKTADYLLRFFEAYGNCLEDQSDGDEEEEDDGKRREDEKFIEDSNEVWGMQQRLMETLSVPGKEDKFNLSRDEALDIAKLCGYELALFNHSAWCDLLSDEDIRVFEYKQDLKHYWKRGYGHPVNYLVGCSLARDVVDYFKQVTSSKKAPKGVFKFAHAETLIPIESILGLYKDDKPLTATTYKEHQNRQFRTSWMAPFAANVAFVLFNCSNDEKAKSGAKSKQVYKFEVLINELPVDLSFCQSESSCNLEDFVKHIGKVTGGRCNFNSTCCIENCGNCVPFEFNQWTIFCITVAGLTFCVWLIIGMIEFGMRRSNGSNYSLLKKTF